MDSVGSSDPKRDSLGPYGRSLSEAVDVTALGMSYYLDRLGTNQTQRRISVEEELKGLAWRYGVKKRVRGGELVQQLKTEIFGQMQKQADLKSWGCKTESWNSSAENAHKRSIEDNAINACHLVILDSLGRGGYTDQVVSDIKGKLENEESDVYRELRSVIGFQSSCL